MGRIAIPCDLTVIQLAGAGSLPVAPAPAPSCHASYQGACLAIGAGDYDCAGGSGNGPNYIAGPIYVVGWDEFELDRDGDGVACE